ncbi:MAG: hypothetical protein MJZ81_06200 [Bacteroidales bacterium]|nr:hypothetical protein [Bacteroidales bacterium]
MDISRTLYEEARRFSPCSLFRGNETGEELMDLFASPQGTEFCMKHDFPSMARFRAFGGDMAEKRGIYIDSGARRLKNARIAILVGDCDFDLEYDTMEHPCKVVLMKGARARVSASGYSVVKIERQEGCLVTCHAHDNAVIRI